VSQLAVWGVDFPGGIGNDNVRWRTFVWGVSEMMLLISIAINYLPPKWYKGVFRFSVFILMLDFFLCLIWLPIAVHNTYGFRSAKFVFTSTCMYNEMFLFLAIGWLTSSKTIDNGTGAPGGWNWLLSL
jgi:translation initiation factor 5B